ncbi:MAX gene-associated protein isoform X9 [Coturnix japonica]|uniref:MAX gene-associated protein isoform X9 n=1 Tax=Coturnix japonica TaxID=93934 RepID=UPI0007780EBA|nr:MAX gene-associated protein isoform X9 [Coturnix japonica]
MEKQQIVLASRDGGTVSGAAPAFFVILKQQQGNGKADQGILVANHDACALASSVLMPVKPKIKTCLPADCVSGGITVTLDNNSMWNEFYHRNTEMILTKQGRRMFPYCRYWITGLDASQKYILVMDISPVDNHRYKWNGRWWEPSGKAEPHVLGRVFIHPESPSTGQYWMHQPVSFYKLKLTNNTLDQEGHIILHSMHRYLPRLHLVPADKATEVIQLNGPDVHTFTFPQTEFFAVTAYQNIQITQLKIDYNPFAKGFRDDGLNSRPQRDVKQNNNFELEESNVFSSASIRSCPAEVDTLELHQRIDSSFIGQNSSDVNPEKESFNTEQDFVGFLDTGLPSADMPKLKQEVTESPNASSYESSSQVESPLDPNGQFNVVVKEEPADDYDYEANICTEGVSVKQEDTDEETDEYSNTDDDDDGPVLQKCLRRYSEADRNDGDFKPRKRVLSSPSGVAKAKMLKLDSGKMPVVYLEPCAVTKSTVKISELPQTMLSSCKKDKSSLNAVLDSLPVCFENHKGSYSDTASITEEIAMKKMPPGNKLAQKYSSIKEAQWILSKSPNFNLRSSVSQVSDKEICGRRKTGVLKNSASLKGSGSSQNSLSSGTTKRGRPRKLKMKAGRPPKGLGKPVITSKNSPVGPGSILPDVKPDLEDVDGVLFVSFASKEALDIHTVDRAGGEESQNLQAPLLTTNDPDCQARIQVLEKELMEELKTLRHKQVIHPSLQEVGLKLNSVDPTMSIDLKYLGVQLPLSYSNYSLWSYPGTNPNSPDTGFPFVSRTGKTNDFRKIKGWRGKLHGASRNEGGGSEGSLKNRSAFCSDKLDEYLENEGKLMETSMGFSSSTPTSPVVYQLPTKSTSYVRTLDSVLKKQSTVIPSTSHTFKPASLSSTSRKTRTQNRQTSSNSRGRSSYKPILPSPFPAKQKQNLSASVEKAAKSLSSSSSSNQADGLLIPNLDESVLPKQISLRHVPQQQQASRPPGLSKSQVKLMDLEDCALWDGKPRTYITEERADISLATLLTAQASLKTKPIHKMIRRRAPPCNNDFCRLGCICASLALEKRQPTHCRRPDCMFGCTCLKRKVLVVKGGSKHKKILKKAVRGNLVLYGSQEEQQEDEDVEEEGVGEEDEMKQKDKRKRKKVEYTICDAEPEKPLRNCPLWVKVEGEIDPEPIYIPTPSVIEPVKSTVLPNPEVVLPSKHRSSSGVKTGRVYTPKPNPVIREEDKDPVYLYFESMMTCARVRVYEPGKEEKKQQKDQKDSQSSFVKMYEQGLPASKKETSKKELPKKESSKKESCKKETSEINKDPEKCGEKSSWSSHSEGDSSSASCVHPTTPCAPSKLIEIMSDCNWNEDCDKILTILSKHINSNMPQSLKVGSLIIELDSEHKAQDADNPPVNSSRVKISVPSNQDSDEKPESPDLETPDSGVPSCDKAENVKSFQAYTLDKLREKLHGGKGLPFYAGISPAGKLVVNKRKANMSHSGLIQVNDKRYPQAKLLLGQMGALHPASRLAAYATGRLRPTVLDKSTLSTVISKVASNASGTPSVQVPTTSAPKTTSSTSTTSDPSVKTLNALFPPLRQIEDATPQTQALNKTPPKITPGTEKRVGPRLLLIPVPQTSPALRPLNNVQVPQKQRMILQPLRSPGGVNLFRHPNGQIIQLVPLQHFRAPGAQPSAQPNMQQPVMFRNPGSIVGIRLPTPSKPPEPPVSLASSASSSSPVKNSTAQTAGPKSSSTTTPATHASSAPPPVTSYVSQAGTLTLKISTPAASNVTNLTTAESKITGNSGVLPASNANVVPLQSGSFALLQLPGQKTVPNSILHHFASLQMKKDSKKVSQKDDSGAAQQTETGKDLHSEETAVAETEVTVSVGKQEETEVSVNQSNNVEESVSGTVTPVKSSTALEAFEKDTKVLEGSGGDGPCLQNDVSTDVISCDHSYISEKPSDEENEAITEVKENCVSSENVGAVSTVSETVCESLDHSLVAPVNDAHAQSLKDQETARLKNHEKEQIHTEREDKPVKEQEGEVQTHMKESNKESSGQSQRQQEQDTQLENKDRQTGAEVSQNKKEFQDGLVQPEVEKRECRDSAEAESLREKKPNKSEISSAEEQHNALGDKQVVSTEEGKTNIATQEGIKNEEEGAVDSQEEIKTVEDTVIHANSSWSKISSIAPVSENRSEADKKADRSERGDFMIPEQKAQEPKHHKKSSTPTTDTTGYMEEEEEDDDDDEDEKTDDSADEILDGAFDFSSEEEIDVEKVFQDACEYSEDDEQVDIETVEELSEKINIARLKATAANIRPSKEKYHARNASDEKLSENPMKWNRRIWSRRPKSQVDIFAYYRQTHTANERRRRNEMRDLFEKLKRALGLQSLPKVSKCYILKQAFDEIQGLTDHADKLTGLKNLLARKQDTLIRKVSILSGKTEEVVLKKLEYMYAKQKAGEAQKKKKSVQPAESDTVVTSPASTRQEASSSALPRDPSKVPMTNRRGKPLILARKGSHATENTSSSLTLTAASLVMTPQGQVLTLKSPLVPGQVAAVPSTLLQAELKPQAASNTMTAQPGIASVMIQLPGSAVPVQVKGILTNSAIPITLSTVAGNPVPSAVVPAPESHSESEDSFMMPKIVNVTSLAAEENLSLNPNRNKSCNVPAASTQASEKSLVTPLESRKSDSILLEEKTKACPGGSDSEGRSATGSVKDFFENKDGFPQLQSVSCAKEPPEPFGKKLCVGELVGSQTRKKDGDHGGERLKMKELPFRKLQIKDSRIEMELRKVASAMEEAEMDAGELLSSIEESDDTDETLTSLLNEIAFLNQQLNDDASGMSELPSALSSDFSHGDAEVRQGTARDLTTADGSSFQFGHLGGAFKDLSEVPEAGGSLSPLLLHLEDDDLTEGDKNSAEPSSEADVLKIVIGAEMKDALPNLSVTSGGNGKTVTNLAESTGVTPPILQMKTNPEASNADALWRPMPKLAPLGLKAASLPVDSEGQSAKVMPLLAPIVAKLAPAGVKTSSVTAQEGQDNKVMPALAPVRTKFSNSGTLPSNSVGK